LPKQRGARRTELALYDWPAGDQAIDDDNHGDYQKNVDQTSSYVHDEGAEQPQDEEYYGDCPKHDGILARS
jgi:hypothetical protein